MEEIKGNLWDFHKHGYYICVTTNGSITKAKRAVMGRGIAKQASTKFSVLSKILGLRLNTFGNVVSVFPDYRLIAFPVKHLWKDAYADLELIKRSCKELVSKTNSFRYISTPIYLPRPGCGVGNLKWEEVKKEIEDLLDSRFIICDLKGGS